MDAAWEGRLLALGPVEMVMGEAPRGGRARQLSACLSESDGVWNWRRERKRGNDGWEGRQSTTGKLSRKCEGDSGGPGVCVFASPSSAPGESVFLGDKSTQERERAKAKTPQTTPKDLLCTLPWARNWSRGSLIMPKGRQGASSGEMAKVGTHELWVERVHWGLGVQV